MTLEELKKRFSLPLPGEKTHIDFAPMRGSTQEAIRNGASYRNSAVSIVLFPNADQKLQIIVIQRQEYDGKHSGQISFPGGKKEEFDRDLKATAIRECFEEIGVDCAQFQFLGQLSQVYIPISFFLIDAFVFYSSEPIVEFKASEREVARIIVLSVDELFHHESVSERSVLLPNGQRIEKISHFTQGDVSIWGATAILLNELKHVFSSDI